MNSFEVKFGFSGCRKALLAARSISPPSGIVFNGHRPRGPQVVPRGAEPHLALVMNVPAPVGPYGDPPTAREDCPEVVEEI